MGKKVKMVLVVRTDIDMSVGKTVAQTGHAVSGLILNRADSPKNWELFDTWAETGQKTVALAAESLTVLHHVENFCQENRVPYVIVRDAGLTSVPEGTITCLGYGPTDEQTAKKITGHLSLL